MELHGTLLQCYIAIDVGWLCDDAHINLCKICDVDEIEHKFSQHEEKCSLWCFFPIEVKLLFCFTFLLLYGSKLLSIQTIFLSLLSEQTRAKEFLMGFHRWDIFWTCFWPKPSLLVLKRIYKPQNRLKMSQNPSKQTQNFQRSTTTT